MVLLQLRHESAIGAHDRPLRSDGGERFAGRHLRRGDEVGDHDGRAPADAHEAMDLTKYQAAASSAHTHVVSEVIRTRTRFVGLSASAPRMNDVVAGRWLRMSSPS